MNQKPLVSVVMPAYNVEAFFAESIESVMQQTYQHWELLIVLDCPTDRTEEIAEEYARKDTRIRVLRNEHNMGVAETRNHGILASKGEFIALLDSDDLWIPTKLERQLALFQKGIDIVYCSYDFINEQGGSILAPFVVPSRTDFKKMLSVSVMSCSTIMVRSLLFKENLFDKSFYHEDYVCWMTLLQKGYQAVGDTRVLAHYRLREGSRSQGKLKVAINRWRVFRDYLHMNLFQASCAFFSYAFYGFRKYFRFGK